MKKQQPKAVEPRLNLNLVPELALRENLESKVSLHVTNSLGDTGIITLPEKAVAKALIQISKKPPRLEDLLDRLFRSETLEVPKNPVRGGYYAPRKQSAKKKRSPGDKEKSQKGYEPSEQDILEQQYAVYQSQSNTSNEVGSSFEEIFSMTYIEKQEIIRMKERMTASTIQEVQENIVTRPNHANYKYVSWMHPYFISPIRTNWEMRTSTVMNYRRAKVGVDLDFNYYEHNAKKGTA